MVENYFFAQPQFATKLKADLPELQAVFTTKDLSAMAGQSQASPAAHIVYLGDGGGTGVGSQGTQGNVKLTTQRWAVVIAVYFGQEGGEAIEQLAGVLIARMLNAMKGWKPEGAARPVQRGPDVQPMAINGFAFYPYVFTVEFVF